MKFTNEILIERSLDQVITLFHNPDNLKEWQPGLQSIEHISGEFGKVGSKARLKYQMGKRKVELIETITHMNLPSEFNGTYESKGVYNHIANSFEAVSETQTRWKAENEFKFSGFMSVFTPFLKGSIRRQSRQFMENFKDFAERTQVD